MLLDVSDVGQAASEDEQSDEDEESDEDDDESPESLAAKQRASINDKALAAMADKGTLKQTSAETIVDHNMFCPTCVPIEEQPLLAAADAQFTGEAASPLRLQLLATMESDDPTWSMATIRDLDSNSLGPYTANDQVRPGVTILAVERGRVVLLNQGRREFISLGDEPPPPAPIKPAAPAPTAKPNGRSSVALDGAEQAIDCANENSCTVDRKFVDQLMKNPQQLMTQARMYPVTQDGETHGFRVSGVRKGSLATMIGLENGDVVSEINGSKLGTIDDALAMYQKLRRANHLSVTVQRGGAVITKEISIK
ncbi:General secretion pathway protein C [Enhygromyxa salina]|uniref:General secretion pathway protein C n=1 Tax=Enhygromyxa salina TaxID=215803 RepID=A0A0C2CZ08_9BACT|nr:General secretion pathway protein C [Enhygromyxa salina]